ncbi:hypothetical protein [Halarcobacter sp.]|uniref:hypothetical protein n=1 Tax=Halarcobacter sp. TaxID=2321133 RepID=UPI0029F53956|nr:hypothetical protein [Halarcobacter sp.]
MNVIRILIAVFGSYLFASLASVTLTFALPFDNKAEAILLATMLSFIIWTLAIIYSFSSVSVKNLFLQFTFICINLYLFNACFMAIKGV